MLAKVAEMILSGWAWSDDTTLSLYQWLSDELSLEVGCVMRGSCMVIPEVGRQLVLGELHVGHPGVSRMKSIARGVVWWPGIDSDIQDRLQTCTAG